MSQQDPNIAGWLTAGLAVLAALAALVKWFFGLASRDELKSVALTIQEEQRNTLSDIRQEQRERHDQNIGNFNETFERLSTLEQRLSRMEGQLSGRYPTLPGKRGQ